MSGTTQVVTLKLETIAEIKQAAHQLQQLKAIIDKMDPGDKLTRRFNEIFTKAQGYAEKAVDGIDKQFKKNSDVSRFTEAVRGLNKQYTALYETLGLINREQLTNFLNRDQLAQFDELKHRLNETSKALEDFKYSGDFDAKFNNLKLTISEVTKGFGQFRNAIEDGNFDKARDVIRNLSDEFQRLKNQQAEAAAGRGKELTERDKVKYEELSKTLRVLNGILTYVTHKFNELTQSNNQASQAMAEFMTANLDPLKKEFDGVADAVRNSNDALRENGNEMAKTGAAAVQMGNELDMFKRRITYFFGLNNAVRLVRRAFREAFNTVKELDKALTETAVVTKFTVQDMWGMIPKYTKQANALGVTIQDVAEASTLYYQQGLKMQQVTELTNATLKMARIAGLEAAEATDRMTNALRGFNMEINQTSADRVADVYSKLAAMSASNVDEISTAMTKVASLAHNANMDFETTSAFLAQIIETTRESAETAGTALKTVVARFSEVKKLFSEGELLGTDEEGEAVDVNKVSAALRTANINLNEYLTGMKGLDDIFLELASKWDTLTNVQQRYIATMAAGSRQQSRFIAMMQDYGRTQELVAAAQDANGASQLQYEKTLDSLATKQARLKNSWHEFITGILDQNIIKVLVDGLKIIIDLINKVTGLLPGVLSSFAKMFVAIKGFKIARTLVGTMFPSAATAIKSIGNKLAPVVAAEGTKNGIAYSNAFSKGIYSYRGWKNALTASFKTLDPNVMARLTAAQLAYNESLAVGTEISHKAADVQQYATAQQVIYSNAITTSLPLLSTKSQLEAQEIIRQYGVGAAQKFANEEQARENALNKRGIIGLLTQLGLKAEQIAATWAEAGAHTGNANSMVGEKVSQLALNKVKLKAIAIQMGLNTAMLEGLAIIGLVIGVIFLIVKAIQAIKNNTPEKRLERTNEELEKASQAAEDAKNAYNNLVDSLDQLNKDYNEFEGLTKGTDAWNEKLKEVNNTVLKLIEEFPELAKYLYIEDGILKFNPEGTGKVIEAQRQKMFETAEEDYTTKQKAIDTGSAGYFSRDPVANYKVYAKKMVDYALEQGWNEIPKEIESYIYDKVWQGSVLGHFINSNERNMALEHANTRLSLIGQSKNAGYGLNTLAVTYGNYDKLAQNSVLQYLNNYAPDSIKTVAGRQELGNKYAEMWSNLADDKERALIDRLIQGKGAGLTNKDIEEINGKLPYYIEILKGVLDASQINSALTNAKDNQTSVIFNKKYFNGNEPTGWARYLSKTNRQAMANSEDGEALFGIVDTFIKALGEGISESDINTIVSNIFNPDLDKKDLNSLKKLKQQFQLLDVEITDDTITAIDKLIGALADLEGAVNNNATAGAAQEKNAKKTEIMEAWENNNLTPDQVKYLTGLGVSNKRFSMGAEGGYTSDLSKQELEKYFSTDLVTLALEALDKLTHDIQNGAGTNQIQVDRDEFNRLLQVVAASGGNIGTILESFGSENFKVDTSEEENKIREQIIEDLKNDPQKFGYRDQDDITADAASIDPRILELREQANQAALDASDTTKQQGYEETINSYKALAKEVPAVTAAVEEYIEAVEKESKVEKNDAAAKIAVRNAAEKDIPAYKKLIDTITDYTDALRDSSNPKYAEAINAVTQAAKEVFGENIDTDLVQEYAKEFANLADGTDIENSFRKISNAIQDNLIQKLGDSTTDVEGLKAQIAALDNSDFGITGTMDGTQVFNTIATILGDAQKAKEYLESLNYHVEESITTDENGNQTRTVFLSGGGNSFIDQIRGLGGGRSGGGSKEKPKYWDNPYDELYNLIEQQNEALRSREKLEREYDRILQNRLSTIDELKQNSLDEIANLQRELEIQKEIQLGRKRQLEELATKGKYRDEDGNEKSFKQWGVDKYASYNTETGLIEIKWSEIDKINDPELGAALEEYISKLEELSESFEETQETIEEMEDQIREIKERNMQDYLEFEERVYEAIVNRQQKIIDEYSALSETISESNSRIINNLRESIDLERQIRDNTKTEEDIADKEARLAYLQRDTSGANQQEILKLQQELDDARQSYSDTLIDQAIDQLEQENQKAEEQRQQQIDIMQAQLDWQDKNGEFWPEVYALLQDSYNKGMLDDGSPLVALLEQSDTFSGLSQFGQKDWMNQLFEEWIKSAEGRGSWENQQVNSNGTTQTDTSGELSQVDSNVAQYQEQISTSIDTASAAKGNILSAGAVWPNEKKADMKKLQAGINDLIRDGVITGIDILVEDGIRGPLTTAAIKKLQALVGTNVDGKWGKNSFAKFKQSSISAYKTGGLVNSTGLAWLDGTKSSPELVLSAADTQNFIALKNALAQMLAQSKLSGKAGGDNYFDIQINVDELANDYDVDQLAARIKKQIYDDSSYRNVNAISYIR